MDIIKKVVALSASVCVSTAVFGACSKNESTEVKTPLSDEEINSRYEEIFSGDEEQELLPEDYNPIADEFTTADFQFTDLADEMALNISENSYASIVPGYLEFKFFDQAFEGENFEGSFKTLKGLGLDNTYAEHAAVYKMSADTAIGVAADGVYYNYAPEGMFTKVTCGYSSTDGISFSSIDSETLLRLLQIRDAAQSSGQGITSDVISQIVETNQTVAFVDLYPNEAGTLNMLTISRFDNVIVEE